MAHDCADGRTHLALFLLCFEHPQMLCRDQLVGT